MSRTNIPFWVWKRGSPTFFDLGIFLNIDLKVVLCLTWRNFCQFWDQFLTDRIFWATFPKHSQNKCFYHVLILSTTVICLLLWKLESVYLLFILNTFKIWWEIWTLVGLSEVFLKNISPWYCTPSDIGVQYQGDTIAILLL